MEFIHKHGDKLQDKVTGFVGVCTGRTDFITGCRQYLLQPRVKEDGTAIDGRWFDEDRLIVIERAALTIGEASDSAPADISAPAHKKITGPDMQAPIK